MLYRKNKQKIVDWIKNGKNALLLTGARQVGKTFLIRETLKEERCDFVEINLVEKPEAIGLFQKAVQENADYFYENLSVLSGKKLIPHKTYFFIDEIQECKEIVTIVKFLVEQGRYKFILSGSLLGVELSDLRSAPVGSLSVIEMYPLGLEEFFIANGLSEDIIEKLRKCFYDRSEVNPFVHQKLLDAFYQYLIVGGMPEAVQNFVKYKDYNRVSEIHKKIYQNYKLDFTKYEKSSKLKLIHTYDLIPAELNDKNKRYIFGDLEKDFKFDRYENSFNWLINSGVALPTYNSTEPVVPLEINKKSNLFKLFLSDVGMLTSFYGRSTQIKLLSKDKDINYGAAFENFVAQELKLQNKKLYYYNSKKMGELDFVIEYMGECLPIEVKSGKDYQKHSALNQVCSSPNYQIKQAIVFSGFNVSTQGNITYYPIYMCMFLNDENFELPKVDQNDLSGLTWE